MRIVGGMRDYLFISPAINATNLVHRGAGHPGGASDNIVASALSEAARFYQAEYQVYSKLVKALDLQARQGPGSGTFHCATNPGKSFPALNW